MIPYLRLKIERLKEEAETIASKQKPTLRTVKPLDTQITDLMATLAPYQRDRRWSMAELVARLEGRYRDNPHPQMIGEALRRLGWSTVRDWTNSGGGRRYWIPSPSLLRTQQTKLKAFHL